MPWKATDVMDQRERFALRAMNGVESFSDLCREFGISRKTGYKWKSRFIESGLSGLEDDSRRPKSCPHGVGEDMVCQIVALKHQHPSWGARKLREVMSRSLNLSDLPSESSFKRVLDKAGLVKRRRRVSQQATGRLQQPVKSCRPNQVWTIDFKGWWRTRDRHRFEPLTIRDDFSRYILYAESIGTSSAPVRSAMEQVFAEYGLPEVIRSDNGSPFAAANSPMGLTRLSSWWLSLGIDLDRIRPGKPQENGGHERMHRDMASDLEKSSAETVCSQQAALDQWRRTFNNERPHEALAMQVPADIYVRSKRQYDPAAVMLTYSPGVLVRRVHCGGRVKIRNTAIQLSLALNGYDVGLESLEENRYRVWFGRMAIGEICLRTVSFKAA